MSMLPGRQRSGDEMVIFDRVQSPLNSIVKSDIHIIGLYRIIKYNTIYSTNIFFIDLTSVSLLEFQTINITEKVDDQHDQVFNQLQYKKVDFVHF